MAKIETDIMVKRTLCFMVMLLALLAAVAAQGQERVYVSTDKNVYLAGEDLWCSVYCFDGSAGKYSSLSSVAYLEFHSAQGLEDMIKIPLIDGRGCGRLQIPFDFATGNYSIVAYTKKYGGDSKGAFKGKIVTVFNTVTAEKVKGGVEVVDKVPELRTALAAGYGNVQLDAVADAEQCAIPVKVENMGKGAVSLNVSIFHYDELERGSAVSGAGTRLLDRRGEFEQCGIS